MMSNNEIWQLNNRDLASNEVKELNSFCIEFNEKSFSETCIKEVDIINQGLGPKASAKRRTIELDLSSKIRKAWLVPHHAKQCLDHLNNFKQNYVVGTPSEGVSKRVAKLYSELVEHRGARLDPIFSPDMLDTFSELEEYAIRWYKWAKNYRSMIESVDIATAYMTGDAQNKMIHQHHRGNFNMMYDELVMLLRDLMALGHRSVYR
ncbi:MAG: hypothetical protein Q8M99_02660 [Methylotenera sp.]|nr:hypothetical protein [Methylotenera sp.]